MNLLQLFQTPKDTTVYKCSVCSSPVERAGDKFYRDCEHKDAGVSASLRATVYGESQVATH